MVHFSKLKLYGFKSFVDKTEIEIGEGLNGIVGPNGCGKSNLVEALRWVMGEKSAKNMRGGGMEDVIFAGTSKRPARNMAEATIVINNQDGHAPAPFNTATEIEITRRIEKDKGSQYRVNGKAVRARDVNLLFADTMTGANSPALVSQGRITEIITSKPQDRRRILEESAGISGLHTRRHEAELRLRAAEQNLARLDDSLNDMRTRMASLKRQARQAERYTEINETIRRIDMALAWSQWRDVRAKIKQDRGLFDEKNLKVQRALEAAKEITKSIEACEKTLPDLRKNAMESNAVLQNFRISLERLEQDIQNKTQILRDAEQSREQIDQDINFSQAKLDQIDHRLTETRNQKETIQSDLECIPEKIKHAEENFEKDKKDLNDLLSQKQSLETQIALLEKDQSQYQQQVDDYQNRLEKIDQFIETLSTKIQDIETEKQEIQNHEFLSTNVHDLGDENEKLKNLIDEQAGSLEIKKETLKDIGDQIHNLSSDIRANEGEKAAIQDLITRTENNNDINPEDALLNHLNVQKGYERAVSLALGHWMGIAGIDATASVYWSDMPSKITPPEGYDSLSNYIEAPQSLSTLLNAVGVYDELPSQPPKFKPGQMIISLDGGLMRWDGLIVTKDAQQQTTDNSAIILEQKNRVSDLEADITKKSGECNHLKQKHDEISSNISTDENKLQSLRDNYESAVARYNTLINEQSRLKDRLKSLDESLAHYIDQRTNALSEQNDIKERLENAKQKLKNSNEDHLESIKDKVVKLDIQLIDAQNKTDKSRQLLAECHYQNETMARDLKQIETDLSNLTQERLSVEGHLETLSGRSDAILTKIRDIKASQNNEDTDDLRESLLNKIAEQEKNGKEADHALETSENEYRALQTSLRNAEEEASVARESRATAQANIAHAEEELRRVEFDIAENFETNPQALEEKIFSLFGESLPTLTDLHGQKDTLTRQREAIGPVNLRAAIESQETETHLAEMEIEYNDLTKAIEQLRGGIAKLNREARDRLATAFKRVDVHFQKLFGDLFDGGKAYLEMIESDDPLESGLEIYAQPPGKALQKLSLLSGGEQTLTATALIFAMFMTNPSPICVLDEIDAPLDDANVDRVCTLMEQIVRETNTRFIVITHHRMTMARMDRLYGVTMSERGISQLVSVDLAMQAELALQNDKESA
jgi:chromosome segregation protein